MQVHAHVGERLQITTRRIFSKIFHFVENFFYFFANLVEFFNKYVVQWTTDEKILSGGSLYMYLHLYQYCITYLYEEIA